MKAQCLPFQQIPHSTRLFLDYLSYVPALREMYPRSPLFSEWFRDEASRVPNDDARRRKVSDILERQNRAWGASSKTLTNIDRLRRGALAAVTGQQVGLFGGPLFAILRELSRVEPPAPEEATEPGSRFFRVLFLVPLDVAGAVQPLLEEQNLPYALKPYHLRDFLEKVSDLLEEAGAIAQPIRGSGGGFSGVKKRQPERHVSRDGRGTSMFASRDDYQMTEEEIAEFERQEAEERKKREEASKQNSRF
ncbi:MAG: bacillithiol biosynthesis cysteine-adding enzyme BshC [Acidobacteriia bacterium]|nr:bacillithiol biosynthesis cysteine-adding enzyme BshC [Terriglobia bacterium]